MPDDRDSYRFNISGKVVEIHVLSVIVEIVVRDVADVTC